jgi:hypothetical protein
MIPSYPLSIALAMVLAAPVAAAAEPAWPKDSASDLSVFVAMQKYRLYADHCAVEVPGLKPAFERLMAKLDGRMEGVSKGLLAAPAFVAMRDKPVPPEIIAAFQDSFHDSEHNLERADAAVVCPKALKDFDAIGDDTLKTELNGTLTAVHTMIQKLQKPGPGQ